MKANNLYLLLGMFVFCSCNRTEPSASGIPYQHEKKQVAAQKYMEWNTDQQHLLYDKQVGNFQFSVKYIPSEFMALSESGTAVSPEKHAHDLQEYTGLYYILFKIRARDDKDILTSLSSSSEAYQKLVRYFSFDIQEDLVLVENGDTLTCVLANFERTYGVSPYCTIMAGFEKKSDHKEIHHDLTFIYKDRVLQTGPVKLLIPAKDLAAIPQPLI